MHNISTFFIFFGIFMQTINNSFLIGLWYDYRFLAFLMVIFGFPHGYFGMFL